MNVRGLVAAFALTAGAAAPASAQALPSVFIEELTWTEIAAAIESGTTTVIIPTAGTEQNGPHMVMGKHKFIVNHASRLIAEDLGNALVAPVVTYVPEGAIDPPTGHMRMAGSISLPNEYFKKLVEYGVRSLRVHGFTDIVLIGDSGGNQRGMREVANALNEEWRGSGTRVHFVGDYYSANGFREWAAEQGHAPEEIGGHAGILDTSLLLSINPEHIRQDQLAPQGGYEGSGVSGDPTKASVEYGNKGMELRVAAALRQIRELMQGN